MMRRDINREERRGLTFHDGRYEKVQTQMRRYPWGKGCVRGVANVGVVYVQGLYGWRWLL